MSKKLKTKANSFTVSPIGPYVIIVPEEEKKTRASGLIVNEDVDESRFIYAKVIATGTGVVLQNGHRTQFETKPGDRVMARKGAGIPLTDSNGTEAVFILESDIFGIIK